MAETYDQPPDLTDRLTDQREQTAMLRELLADARDRRADDRDRRADDRDRRADERDLEVENQRRERDAAVAEAAGLRIAMQTRSVIEQAKGMIMISLKVDADAAFDVLVKRSQTQNTKLIEVAREIVALGTMSDDEARE